MNVTGVDQCGMTVFGCRWWLWCSAGFMDHTRQTSDGHVRLRYQVRDGRQSSLHSFSVCVWI